MQIGTLVKFILYDEYGIVTQRVPNEFNRWVVIGLTGWVGVRYEVVFPNKNMEVICK